MTVIYSDLGDVDCSCLPLLWKGIEGVKVITLSVDSEVTRREVMEAVAAEDDTVLLCGHGTPDGLLGYICDEVEEEDEPEPEFYVDWDKTHYNDGNREMDVSDFINKVDEMDASKEGWEPTGAHRGSEDRPAPQKRIVKEMTYNTAVDWDMLKDTLHAKRIIGVWCHASSFAEEHNLPGFWTSMFISNRGEARYYGYNNVSNQVIVDELIRFCMDVNELIKKNVPQDQWVKRIVAHGHMNIPTTKYNYGGLRYYPR